MIVWDAVANAGLPSFNTGHINFFAPHLQQNVTDVRIAMMQGISPDDFDLFAPDIGSPLTFDESPLGQEQESLEYEFRLDKAAKEAERMRIEAEGIRDYQEIVSRGISQELLKWKGIEATSALANSQNTKVVVIGSAKDGLPLILGDN